MHVRQLLDTRRLDGYRFLPHSQEYLIQDWISGSNYCSEECNLSPISNPKRRHDILNNPEGRG